MHPNPAFRQSPQETNLAFARTRGFGVLTVNGVDGPLAAHVPFLLSDCGGFADLHLAQSNLIARATLPGPGLLAVGGPDTYVSPDWYGPHDQVPDQVPTWNYVAVHLRGVLEQMDEATLAGHVDALSAKHEGRIAGKLPWTSAKMTEGAMTRMLRHDLAVSPADCPSRGHLEAEPEQTARSAGAGGCDLGTGRRKRAVHRRPDAGHAQSLTKFIYSRSAPSYDCRLIPESAMPLSFAPLLRLALRGTSK